MRVYSGNFTAVFKSLIKLIFYGQILVYIEEVAKIGAVAVLHRLNEDIG